MDVPIDFSNHVIQKISGYGIEPKQYERISCPHPALELLFKSEAENDFGINITKK